MKKDTFIIIDGNSLMHRAFYAIPPLTNSKNLHTNVIYGFINMINKLIENYKPSYIAIAFDKGKTFRHAEYAEYKAGRKKMPDEMAEQIPVLKQVIDAMKIKRIELEGYEADDLIGTLSYNADKLAIDTHIVTGDRDAFQLITDNVKVAYTKRGITEIESFDENKLIEKYSITPTQVTDMKGLMGDSSDNIPGVPGVGEKTALELLAQFGSIENLLLNINEIKKNKVREKIEQNKDLAVFSKKLATIVLDVPIDFKIDEYKLREPDYEGLKSLYTELEFKSLLDKLTGENKSEGSQKTIDLKTKSLEKNEDINRFFDTITKKGKIYFNIYDTDLYILDTDTDEVLQIELKSAIDCNFSNLLKDQNVKKYGHDIKKDILTLMKYNIDMQGIGFDTFIAAYLLNPSKNTYTLSELSIEQLGMEIEDTISHGVYILEKLCDALSKKLEDENMKKLYEEIELPLITVLACIENEGFKIDTNILCELSEKFSQKIDGLTDAIYLQAGEKFNINSPKQLGVILFEKLGLPTKKKTKTGYSTDVEVLEELSKVHPIPELILEYRQLLKLKSTYIDGLLNIMDKNTSKLHTKLNQTVTATGRLSSTEPNLQNIPIKTEEGRQIRRAFIPKNDEYILVDADYSQIELRVLAHISGDEGLIDAFIKNQDIHTRTACEVFGVTKEEVTPLMRSRAKAVNFGIVYGQSDFGLSKELGITKKEAKLYIDNYFKRYPKVLEYMEDVVKQAKEEGYVRTIFGRRRYINEISSKNAIMRNMGERIAMNTPIQGSAADIIKIAMVKVFNELRSRELRSKLILQVHDELIVETHKDELEEVKVLLKQCMESAVSLNVPLTVDVHWGNSWYDAK